MRSRNGSRQAVFDIWVRAVREYPLATLWGCLAVADETKTRVRCPSV
ncbi:MAG: hypothetical protein MK289_09825 [Trichodesmium sp. ALOHA_ZT_67]|nr:hypothetical protein [Trichodesmium sp. ALOHA_ZT_67]